MDPQRFDSRSGYLHPQELTRRESEVHALVLQGLANRQIARQLGIVEETVKFHISNILKKLKARSRVELIARQISPMARFDLTLTKEAHHMEHNTTPPADFGADRLRDFPGPVVLAAEPDAAWRAVWGASEADGRPDGADVRYRSATGLVPLFIRTVLPELVPPPVIGTTHDLATTLLDMRTMATGRRTTSGRGRTPTRDDFRALADLARREEAHADTRSWAVAIDGVELHGHRKDFADGSVAEVHWDHGIRVLCAGEADVLDRLKLCSATSIPWEGAH